MCRKELVGLIHSHRFNFWEFFAEESMVRVFEYYRWLFFEAINGEIFDVLPHQLCCSCLRTALSDGTIGSCTHIGDDTFASTCVFFQILLKSLVLLVLRSWFDFILDWLRDQIWYLEALLHFGCCFIGRDQCSSEILWSLGLYFV